MGRHEYSHIYNDDIFSHAYKVLDTISCWSLQLNLVNTNHGYTFEVTFALHTIFLCDNFQLQMPFILYLSI